MRNLLLLSVVAFAAAACGGDGGLPPRNTDTTSSSTSGAGGGGGIDAAGGAGAVGGAGGQAGQGGVATGGAGGGLPAPYCGDLIISPNEECDDGNNDPGDGCAADCKIEPGETEPNNTFGQASPYKNPFPAKIDPEGDIDFVSFAVTQANTSVTAKVIDIGDGACPAGNIDTVLTVLAADGTTVLVMDDDAGEGFCSKAILPSLGIGNYFVRVEAAPDAVPKTFVYRLRVDLTVDVCGDGTKGFSEACDDGNTMAGDGCSPTCTVEVSEMEPNDTTANANTFVAPFNAVLTPKADIDIVAVNIAASGASLTATTTDQGSNACAAKTLDTKVEILATNGTTVLAMGDDIIGNCGSALATNLAAGTYYVRITGGSLVTDPSPYGLNIIIQ